MKSAKTTWHYIIYNNCARQSAQKDIIVLLYQQFVKLASQLQSLNAVIADQQQELPQQAANVADQQGTPDQKLRTILARQTISQQKTIIQNRMH
ncbi:MAG: hypothetical protein ABIN89_20865 [Chitinophagaceae bacterium]